MIVLSRWRRAARATGSVLPLVPKSRSNTARGSRSTGSGVVGLRHEMVFVYAQLDPPSHVPSIAFDSIPSSSEVNCVCLPSSWAATWSMEVAAYTSAPVVNLNVVAVRNVPAERA